MNIHFIIPGDIRIRTGGNIYNLKIIEGLRGRGYKVFIHDPGNDFPFPDAKSLKKADEIIHRIRGGEIIVIDSLVLGPVYNTIRNYSGKNPMIGLIHLPLYMNPALSADVKSSFRQQEALSYSKMRLIITVSNHTKELLAAMAIPENMIRVIHPQAESIYRKDNYPLHPASLLCAANYTRNKGYLNLIRVMAMLKEINWTMHCYGNKDMDSTHFREVKTEIEKHGLIDRILLNDSYSQADLEEIYLGSDLMVLPSEYESYPMVVAEALVHGIPVIAARSGGIPELVPEGAGMLFEPGDSSSMVSVLKTSLTDERQYRTLCEGAAKAHTKFRSWSDNVLRFEFEMRRVLHNG